VNAQVLVCTLLNNSWALEESFVSQVIPNIKQEMPVNMLNQQKIFFYVSKYIL
jgi:hypothetical protein